MSDLINLCCNLLNTYFFQGAALLSDIHPAEGCELVELETGHHGLTESTIKRCQANLVVKHPAYAAGMPLTAGFTGAIPALEFLTGPREAGPMKFSIWQLIVWSLGICFFGVVLAVPLRRRFIVRERLRFPTGTAIAAIIGVLHGDPKITESVKRDQKESSGQGVRHSVSPRRSSSLPGTINGEGSNEEGVVEEQDHPESANDKDLIQRALKDNIVLMVNALIVSGIYTLTTYFFPTLRSLPVFGRPLAEQWLWTFNPSPAYIGQGLIVSPATTAHMLVGAILGWGILSPVAKVNGWAPGEVDDWEHGSRGWITWISLAILVGDTIVNLSWFVIQPLAAVISVRLPLRKFGQGHSVNGHILNRGQDETHQCDEGAPLLRQPSMRDASPPCKTHDAPQQHLISNRSLICWFSGSTVLCLVSVSIIFGKMLPVYATIAAIAITLPISVVCVRATGETDFSPVQGISKLTQFFFALIIPISSPTPFLVNIAAGAITEAGSWQASDLMSDLKSGYLVGASPKALFYGQIIGSFFGAFVSSAIYRLYTLVYPIPGRLFPVPVAHMWFLTAKLAYGDGLPKEVWKFAVGAASLWAIFAIIRITAAGHPWRDLITSGVAVSVGMYNVPSFTIARAIGGLIRYICLSHLQMDEMPVLCTASGLVLGEGLFSIISLAFTSLGVPHF